MLKEKASLLQRHDEHLFGKKFRNHIADTIKSKKQTKKIFIEHIKPFSFEKGENGRSKSFSSQKPDRKNSIMVTNKNNNNVIPTTDRQGVSNRDMTSITTSQQTFFSMDLNPEKPIQWESRKVYPLRKRLFLPKSITFCRSLYESNTGSQNFGHGKRTQNSISFKSFSAKSPFSINSELRRGRIGETGGKRNVNEGSHQKNSTIKRGLCKQHIPCKKKDGGQRPVINLKELNADIPYCHFKMKGAQNRKYMLQKGDYMCKLDLNDAYFSVPLEKNSRQFVRFR